MIGSDVSLRDSHSLAYVKVIPLHLFSWMPRRSKQELDNNYITLKNVLIENSLMDKPGQIYNVDESEIPLDHHSPHVFFTK